MIAWRGGSAGGRGGSASGRGASDAVALVCGISADAGSAPALVGPSALGAVGQPIRLQLDFHLAATDTQEQVMLDAVIQTVQALRNTSGQVTGHHHGLRFERVEPRILLLVNELLNPQNWRV